MCVAICYATLSRTIRYTRIVMTMAMDAWQSDLLQARASGTMGIKVGWRVCDKYKGVILVIISVVNVVQICGCKVHVSDLKVLIYIS